MEVDDQPTEVVRTIKLASAKAAIKDVCEKSRDDAANASRVSEGYDIDRKFYRYLELNTPTIRVISDMIDEELTGKANQWWTFHGRDIWLSEIKAKPYLYFNHYVVGCIAAQTFLAFWAFIDLAEAIPYAIIFGIVAGSLYAESIQNRAHVYLFWSIRRAYQVEQLDLRLKQLLREHDTIVWQNLEQLFDDDFLRKACLDLESEPTEQTITPDYFIKGVITK